MSEVSFAPFNIEIQGLGVFPSLNYARVIWAGIQGGADELRNICNQLDSFLRGLGLKLDSKGFSPHITIARVRTGRHKAELIRRIMDIKDFDFGVIKANYIRLKKSVLTQKGPIYNTIYEVNAVES
jgi:2'-5' RNA ligase